MNGPAELDSSLSSFCLFVDYSASLGSEEESGKDWDELEEEARKGSYLTSEEEVILKCGVGSPQRVMKYQVGGSSNNLQRFN